MRAASVVFVLVGSLLGCNRHEEEAPTAASRPERFVPRPSPNRCTLAPPDFVTASQALGSPWIVAGPNAPRVLSRTSSNPPGLFWREGSAEGFPPSSLSLAPQALGWTGQGFVGVADDQAVFTDANFANPRPIRRVPLGRATGFTVAPREGAALVAWIREGRNTNGEGLPWVTLIGPDGDPLMEPRPLPMGDYGALLSMEVRWDFGRFVVEGYTSGPTISWVLEPDGRDVSSNATRVVSPVSGRIVCPISGCLRIDVDHSDRNRSQTIRLTPLTEPDTLIDTNIYSNDLRAVVVSGDRVLMIHHPVGNDPGCALHVYDVGRRMIAHESTSASLNCGSGSVVATPSGFAVLEVDTPLNAPRRIAVHALSCGDDA